MPGHERKQVVLNLVLEPAVVPRRPPVRRDVERRDALEPEEPEVHRGVEGQHRHRVVVHVQHQVQHPAHRVGDHEIRRPRTRFHRLQDERVVRGVARHEAQVRELVLRRRLEDGYDVQVNPSHEDAYRDVVQRLEVHHRAKDRAQLVDHAGVRTEHGMGPRGRVAVDYLRHGVVLAVLHVPPPRANAADQGAEDVPQALVHLGVPGQTPVAAVVRQEQRLLPEQAQKDGARRATRRHPLGPPQREPHRQREDDQQPRHRHGDRAHAPLERALAPQLLSEFSEGRGLLPPRPRVRPGQRAVQPGVLHDRLLDDAPDVERVERLVHLRPVKRGEHVRRVSPGVRPQQRRPTRMPSQPSRAVVHAPVDRDQHALGRGFGELPPGPRLVLGVDAHRLRAGAARDRRLT